MTDEELPRVEGPKSDPPGSLEIPTDPEKSYPICGAEKRQNEGVCTSTPGSGRGSGGSELGPSWPSPLSSSSTFMSDPSSENHHERWACKPRLLSHDAELRGHHRLRVALPPEIHNAVAERRIVVCGAAHAPSGLRDRTVGTHQPPSITSSETWMSTVGIDTPSSRA